MPWTDDSHWNDQLAHSLSGYSDSALRNLAQRFLRPRNQWPADELVRRIIDSVANAPFIDRRLQEAHPDERRLLAVIGRSRQPEWRLGSIVEIARILGINDDLGAVHRLLENGLLFPSPAPDQKIPDLVHWFSHTSAARHTVFALPQVTRRAALEPLNLPFVRSCKETVCSVTVSDGLFWPLRCAVLWQHAAHAPFRMTMTGDLFKRDLERLESDPIFGQGMEGSAPAAADLPAPAIALACSEGILLGSNGELRPGKFPESWQKGTLPTIESLWTTFTSMPNWNAGGDQEAIHSEHSPYSSAFLLALITLAELPPDRWASTRDLSDWVVERHPFWAGQRPKINRAPGDEPSDRPIETFLVGMAHQLALVELAQVEPCTRVVRLSAIGRALFGVQAEAPEQERFPKTLLVQPNLEIVVYRQGLTPGLIASLSEFAEWRMLGAACTLKLTPESVYRGLERGWTFESILALLERHGTRSASAAVVEALRTWANKRERLSVYPSALLLEFSSASDLDTALSRGLLAVRLTDRLAVVSREGDIDFRHFRLQGTRDYGLPPDQCVQVADDGITLLIDTARSDLLLETELAGFAERASSVSDDHRRYQVSVESLARGRQNGWNRERLAQWFRDRTGQDLPPATRLLLGATSPDQLRICQQVVLYIPDPIMADGIIQWPETRNLVKDRIGPTAITVPEENVDTLRGLLEELGLGLDVAVGQVQTGTISR